MNGDGFLCDLARASQPLLTWSIVGRVGPDQFAIRGALGCRTIGLTGWPGSKPRVNTRFVHEQHSFVDQYCHGMPRFLTT